MVKLVLLYFVMGVMEHFLLHPFSLPISEKFKNAQEENGEICVQISRILGTPPPSLLIKSSDEIFKN